MHEPSARATVRGLLQRLSRESLYLFSATFSPNGRFLAATADDRDYQGGYNLRVWDLESNRASIQTFPGEGCVFSQCYSPDGRHLVGGTQDGRILVWDGLTGQTNSVLGQHNGAVFALVFSPDGRHLASASHTEQVKFWDATRLALLQSNPVELATTAVGEISGTLAFSDNSQRLVVATDDQLATVWDTHRGTMLLPVRSDSVHGFRAVAFSPDGRWIASGGTDCRVKVWDAETGVLLHTFRGHKGEVLRVGFLQTPDGLRLISGSRDCTIKVWNLVVVQDRDPRR